MLEAVQNYSFEYQGNASKLVHTPLTDKCYLTMMHGMHLCCVTVTHVFCTILHHLGG